jgi:hypothetical protein
MHECVWWVIALGTHIVKPRMYVTHTDHSLTHSHDNTGFSHMYYTHRYYSHIYYTHRYYSHMYYTHRYYSHM